jgi:hypothetical protein
MEQASRCTHPEAHVTGLVDEFGNLFSAHVVGHDCEYIEARNSLIPFAEAKANKAVGRAAPVVGGACPARTRRTRPTCRTGTGPSSRR